MSQIHREQLKVMAERAILVEVVLPGDYVDASEPLGELRALAETAGATVVGELMQKRRKPRGRTYLGKGKVAELAALAKMTDATLAIFDNDLSPAQIRALEQAVECKIIDRSELILDIFANRATTHMARIQVEIAQLEYTYPRLRAMWDHLGQIVGGAPVGIGTRGPGEQQIEIDRRLVQRRLKQLRTELAQMQQRKTREVAQRNLDHYTVGLVGYTNAGKSTLFNRATAGGAFAHAKLFATLSTRVERWELGGGNHVMLSDTVGFIRELPHHLVASFKSTLEETVHAQLLIILVDALDPNAEMQLETVMQTLDEIGATYQRRVIVLNKIDVVADSDDVLVWLNRHPDALPISAATGQGLDELAEVVLDHMLGGVREVVVAAALNDSNTIDFLEKRTEVLERDYPDGKAALKVRLGRRHVDLLLARGAKITINGMQPLEAIAECWPETDDPASGGDEERPPPHERFCAEEEESE
ncbi:MAG: GTPase HflX [Phycisphaerales bacterium]|nr:MAG: GTPase HflX [Phycisphaerales bacterium]